MAVVCRYAFKQTLIHLLHVSNRALPLGKKVAMKEVLQLTSPITQTGTSQTNIHIPQDIYMIWRLHNPWLKIVLTQVESGYYFDRNQWILPPDSSDQMSSNYIRRCSIHVPFTRSIKYSHQAKVHVLQLLQLERKRKMSCIAVVYFPWLPWDDIGVSCGHTWVKGLFHRNGHWNRGMRGESTRRRILML